MWSFARFPFVVVLLALASGCASNLNVTYTSDPPGATLYQGNTAMGLTPYTLRYPVTDDDKKAGHKRLQGTTVRWVSGASASVSYLDANFSNGMNQQFNFLRPSGVPGADTDANYALQLQRNQIMREQAAAQAMQAEYQRQQANSLRQIQQQQQQQMYAPRPPVNCTSNALGSTVYTNCY